MFINVQPLNGPPQQLTYHISDDIDAQELVGAIVQVPLRNRTIHALIIEYGAHLGTQVPFAIRSIIKVEKIPLDREYQPFIHALATYYQLSSTQLLKRLLHFLALKTTEEYTNTHKISAPQQVTLSQDQEIVCAAMGKLLENNTYQPMVLHGVTGSGKTEIYKKLITQTLLAQKSIIVMLPEVSLALQFEHIFKQSFSKTIVHGFHSASSKNEKKELWQSLLHNQPLIIIGVHQPILLPINNLGLIIVDEEHESGYQEKKHPKINSKEAALLRAARYNIPIILGSATPSVNSLYNTQKRGWKLFTLTKRYQGAFPVINVVYLISKKWRRSFWISPELEIAIADRLEKKEQTILFLNRRGFSFFVQCTACGYTFECKRCSVSLTLHDNDLLQCHYCGTRKKLPICCPKCQKTEFLKRGIGTQQLVQILQKLFPVARIARADLDTTSKKKSWQKILEQFNTGEIDILVGTQTITKGYHFAGVTLVGIIWADLHLSLPHFNATQNTLQLLLQVAGRAGRERPESQVIVQSMTHHPIFEHLHEENYLKFFARELEQRSLLGYPPCGRFAEIEFTHPQESVVIRDAAIASNYLANFALPALTVLGPAAPPVAKIKNINRRAIYLKSPTIQTIIVAYQQLKKQKFKSTLHFNPSA